MKSIQYFAFALLFVAYAGAYNMGGNNYEGSIGEGYESSMIDDENTVGILDGSELPIDIEEDEEVITADMPNEESASGLVTYAYGSDDDDYQVDTFDYSSDDDDLFNDE